MTPSLGLVSSFDRPVFPRASVSLPTFSLFPCSFFLEHLLCSMLPGLLVRLHLVSIFSDLPFRSLQVSGLYIYPDSIPVCDREFPPLSPQSFKKKTLICLTISHARPSILASHVLQTSSAINEIGLSSEPCKT